METVLGIVFGLLAGVLRDRITSARWLWLCLLVLPVSAQVGSRTEEIEAARSAKAQRLEPDDPPRVEQALTAIRDGRVIERFTAGIAGFRVKLGGMVSGSGFAAGPEYVRRDLADGQIVFRGSARASLKKYQLCDLQLTLPKLAGDKAFLDLYAVHRNYPSIDYYGPGPGSSKSARSNYRLEDTGYDVTTGFKPLRHLKLGVTGGHLQVNVGPGGDSRFVSAEKIFNATTTPGIDGQTNFLRSAAFAQYDYRDIPGGPRKGGNYLLRYSYYSDREVGRYSFQRLDMEAQQYFAFFNERRVIALRGKTVLTDAGRGQSVPFYLQPTLGGSDDLRGFRPFRFYDDNMMVLNAEYRWETFSGRDLAVFIDSGKVFHDHSQWNLRNLEVAYGFGMRFNVRNEVFLRLDFGFSHEGYQVWVKFNNVF